MANLDVVARLQLRAEQFSSENGRAFSELKTRAASAAQEVRQSFTSSFAEVQKVASSALTLPKTQTGGLNLGAEIVELERLAAEADRNAVAQQQLSVAFTAASAAGRGNAEALRQNADAAAVASLAAEREAASLRERLDGYRQVQIELNRTVGVTELHSRVANDNAVSAGQQRAAMQQLGYQVGDVAAQFSAGTPAMIIFAQQGGQVVQALQLMTNKTTGLLGFLGGPWGAVIGAAAVVVGTLAAKLFDSSDAAKEKENAAKKLTAQIDGLYESTMRQVRAEEFFRAATLASANAALVKAAAQRQQTQASLDSKISEARAARAEADAAKLAISFGEGGEVRSVDAVAAARKAEAAAKAERELLRQQVAEETRAREAQRAAQLIEANARVAESLDKVTAAQGRNRRAVDQLAAGYTAGRITLSEYEARKRSLDAASQKEVEGLRQSGSAARSAATAIADANGKLAGATSEVQRAEAELARTRATARADLKAGRIDQDEYSARIGAATRAVNEAREATRGHAAAARDAAAAQRELESTYQSVVTALDPALAATLRYRDTLKDIAALGAAGKLTPGEVTDYTLRAIQQKQDADRKAQSESFRGIVGTDVDAELNGIVSGITEGFVRELDPEALGSRFGRGAGDELGRAVDSIAYLFGGRLSGPLAQVLQPGGVGREARETSEALVGSLKDLGLNLSADVAKSLKDGIATAFSGAAFGGLGGSVFSAITGGRDDKTASAIGGVLGEVAGKSLSKPIGDAIGGTLGKTLGSAAGPLGAIAGGIIGNVIGGIFGGQKAQYGAATIQLVNGAVKPGQVVGNSTAGATGLAGDVSKSVQAIADQLGATISSLPKITVGTFKDNYRVSTTGYVGQLDFNGKSAVGLKDFGGDEEAAIRFAVSKIVSGAVITGISDASKRIVQSAAGDDIETAIAKALLIEAVPKDLKAALDPVGAAIDALNTKFQKTVDALTEGGATAEQMAQAQQLYNLQLAEVKASTASASQGLKDFLTKLKTGTDSPLSLRDQEAAVRAELSPYLSAIDAGQRVDQGKYQDVAQRFLDIERSLYGSTQSFFDAFDAVQASTAKAIATIDNAVPITPGVESPFAKATADSAAATAQNTAAGNELLSQVSDQLEALQATLAGLGLTSSGSGFIGAERGYA